MGESKIAAILGNRQYQEYMEYNRERELERIYCRHGWEHSIDVARVAYILVLEQGQMFSKEIVYAAGLLHDIGRWQQYDLGLDHAQIGGDLAEPILRAVHFTDEEILLIQSAIRNHREPGQTISQLGKILYLADKAVRPCITCPVRVSCKKINEMDLIQIEQGNIY